jgi:hypothetical protein
MQDPPAAAPALRSGNAGLCPGREPGDDEVEAGVLGAEGGVLDEPSGLLDEEGGLLDERSGLFVGEAGLLGQYRDSQ